MRNKLFLGVAALAFAGSTMVAGAASDSVLVNIEVAPVVSLWSNDASIDLLMNGADANNAAAVQSSLSIINNVDAKIDASVTGSLPNPTVPGGGINFFLFHNVTPAAAIAAMDGANPGGNAYNPAGSIAWTQATLGTSQNLVAATGVNTSILNVPVTYASNAPGDLPLPNSFALTVTYTITSLTP